MKKKDMFLTKKKKQKKKLKKKEKWWMPQHKFFADFFMTWNFFPVTTSRMHLFYH